MVKLINIKKLLSDVEHWEDILPENATDILEEIKIIYMKIYETLRKVKIKFNDFNRIKAHFYYGSPLDTNMYETYWPKYAGLKISLDT